MSLQTLDVDAWRSLVPYLDFVDLIRLSTTGNQLHNKMRTTVRHFRFFNPSKARPLPITIMLRIIKRLSACPESFCIKPGRYGDHFEAPGKTAEWHLLGPSLKILKLDFWTESPSLRSFDLMADFPNLTTLKLRGHVGSFVPFPLPPSLTYLKVGGFHDPRVDPIHVDSSSFNNMPPGLRVLELVGDYVYTDENTELDWRHLPLTHVDISLTFKKERDWSFLPPTIISLTMELHLLCENGDGGYIPPSNSPESSWATLFPNLQHLRTPLPSLLKRPPQFYQDPNWVPPPDTIYELGGYAPPFPPTLTSIDWSFDSHDCNWNTWNELDPTNIPLFDQLSKIGTSIKRLNTCCDSKDQLGEERIADMFPNLGVTYDDTHLIRSITMHELSLEPLPHGVNTICCQIDESEESYLDGEEAAIKAEYAAAGVPRDADSIYPIPSLFRLAKLGYPPWLTSLTVYLDSDAKSKFCFDFAYLPKSLTELDVSEDSSKSVPRTFYSGGLMHLRYLKSLDLDLNLDSPFITSASQLPLSLTSIDRGCSSCISDDVLEPRDDEYSFHRRTRLLMLRWASTESNHHHIFTPLHRLMSLPPNLQKLDIAFDSNDANVIDATWIKSLPWTLRELSISRLAKPSDWSDSSTSCLQYLPYSLESLFLETNTSYDRKLAPKWLPDDILSFYPHNVRLDIRGYLKISEEAARLQSTWKSEYEQKYDDFNLARLKHSGL